jgi:hypothetical protein
VLNQFKQSKVNKPKVNKDTNKQMSLLNVNKCSKYVGNKKDNKFILKPKRPQSSFKQNSQMITIATTSNKHSLNSNNSNSGEVRYANTAENTKIVNRKGINVPVTVINLFSGDDGANNNADKCDMGNVHARNLSERIGIENDFKNVDMNNNNNNNIPHEKKIKVFFFKKSTNKKK